MRNTFLEFSFEHSPLWATFLARRRMKSAPGSIILDSGDDIAHLQDVAEDAGDQSRAAAGKTAAFSQTCRSSASEGLICRPGSGAVCEGLMDATTVVPVCAAASESFSAGSALQQSTGAPAHTMLQISGLSCRLETQPVEAPVQVWDGTPCGCDAQRPFGFDVAAQAAPLACLGVGFGGDELCAGAAAAARISSPMSAPFILPPKALQLAGILGEADAPCSSPSAGGDKPSPAAARATLRLAERLDPLQLPSVGSSEHNSGGCQPCAYVWRAGGCENGTGCRFCHLCLPGEKRRRIKAGKAARRSQNIVAIPDRLTFS